MEYVINLLEKEKAIFEKLLNDWDINQQVEARKNRDDKLKQLNNAINILKKWNNYSELKTALNLY